MAAGRLSGMPILHRVAAALGISRDDAATPTMLPGITPPARTGGFRAGVSLDQATGLSTVYRAMQIMETAAEQLSIYAERGGKREAPAPPLVRRPSLDMDRSEFIAGTVVSMMASGNFYWLHRGMLSGTSTPADLELLNPHEVRPNKDPQTGRISYHYRGTKYTAAQITHRAMLRMPGRLTGLGPIQAAQIELRGALELRDYSSLWFSNSHVPSGVLTSEQVITAEDAKMYRTAWNADPDDANPSGVKVLGKGTRYEHLFLKPADAQWLESQKFTTTAVARLFGIPASLLLAPTEGTTDAYRNVEQDWLAFTRFTLMGYLKKIENALSALLPRGTEARFNIEALLRSDTKSRYDSYAVGISNGFLHPDEAREIEGRAPLTEVQREQLAQFSKGKTSAPQEATK